MITEREAVVDGSRKTKRGEGRGSLGERRGGEGERGEIWRDMYANIGDLLQGTRLVWNL